MQYAYFIGCLIFFSVWLLFFILRKDLRKEIIFGSLLALPFGFIERLWVPEYWNPPSFFDLISRYGFGLESFFFCFICGGTAAVIYEIICSKKTVKIRLRRRYLFGPFVSVVAIFILLDFLFSDKTIYNAIIASITGAVMIAYKRKDLISQIIFGGVFFATVYFLLFFIFSKLFPGYISMAYTLENLCGVLILGIPLEELFASFGVGALWTSFYEYIRGYRTKNL
jgi:hypothetical protein